MMNEILFVCTGNTCRSPMAMAIYNAVTKTDDAKSAGLQVLYPSKAAVNAVQAVKKYGAELENHISYQLTSEMLKNFRVIVTMTSTHKMMLENIKSDLNVMTLAEFAGGNEDVSDPYGGDFETYERTASMIYDYIIKGIGKNTIYKYAGEEDAYRIAETEKSIFPDAWSFQSISEEVMKKGVVKASFGSFSAGYCIFMTAADEAEILRIAVEDKMRNNGIGAKLIDFALNEFKIKGIENVYLEVRSGNSAARHLYEKKGFKEIDIRKAYYRDNGEDAVIYKLTMGERL